MARDKKLNPIISQIRERLKDSDRECVDSGFQEWKKTANGDFEVFLDILEGVITTPLKRIYKAKLRRNDDWWYKNFAHNPVAFFDLFDQNFHHRKMIISWLLESLYTYEAISDRFLESAKEYFSDKEKPTHTKIVDQKRYYVYANSLGERPTSLEEMPQYLQKNRAELQQSKLTCFQMMDASGLLVSPQITYLNTYKFVGNFRYWDPDKDEGYGECDEWNYGKEYLEMKGSFPFLIRYISSSCPYLMYSRGESVPLPEVPNHTKETAGTYLILISDTTVQLETDLIIKEGTGLGLKIDAIEHALVQSAICISFSDKGHQYSKRWLFPHPDGSEQSINILKKTTLVDDWVKMKTLLPTLEECDKKTVLYFFLEHLPQEKQGEVRILLEEPLTP